jgi:hypothetical protein
MTKTAIVVAAMVAALLAGVLGAMAADGRFSSSSDRPTVIANKIGASYCTDSGYLLELCLPCGP